MIEVQIGRRLLKSKVREHCARCITLKANDVYERDNKLVINTKKEIPVGEKIPFNITIKEKEKKYATYYVNNEFAISEDSKEVQVNEFLINDTTVFALPLLGLNKATTSYHEYLVNAYTGIELPGEDDKIYLVFRFIDSSSYSKVMDNLRSYYSFESRTKYKRDPRFDIVTMNIGKYQNDYRLFKEGKFSKMSKYSKADISNFHKLSDTDDIYAVLNKSDWLGKRLCDSFQCELKDLVEFRPKPNLTKEIFNYVKT